MLPLDIRESVPIPIRSLTNGNRGTEHKAEAAALGQVHLPLQLSETRSIAHRRTAGKSPETES
jgi:hypothetical protein